MKKKCTPLLLLAFCLGALVAVSAAEASFEPGWAKAAFAAFVKHYWSTSDHYLLNQYPSNGSLHPSAPLNPPPNTRFAL
jgi:hypothetical protein